MEYPIIDMKATGKNINEIRIKKNIKVEEIMRFMGMNSPTAVYKWLRGESLPSTDNFYALSEFLQVPINDLIIRKR